MALKVSGDSGPLLTASTACSNSPCVAMPISTVESSGFEITYRTANSGSVAA